ncbi:hypothetical protein JCM11491_001533 [Sporobolomyces phaffii]
MLFTRIALPLLGLAASVLAAQSPARVAALSRRHDKAPSGGLVSVEVAIETATKQIVHAGVGIGNACAANEDRGPAAITAAVKPHLIEIQTSLRLVSAAIRTNKDHLLDVGVNVDLQGLGSLVAGLLNAVVSALLPLHALVKVSLGLRHLLNPVLALVGEELSFILETLFSLVDGLLPVVLNLVNGALFVVFRTLGGVLANVFGILGFIL